MGRFSRLWAVRPHWPEKGADLSMGFVYAVFILFIFFFHLKTAVYIKLFGFSSPHFRFILGLKFTNDLHVCQQLLDS